MLNAKLQALMVTFPDICDSTIACATECWKEQLWIIILEELYNSIAGLLLTVVVLFGFQAHKIISNPFIILLISIPLLIQTYGIYVITYLLAFRLSIPYNIAAPAALIGTSNFFELAVAVAISLFGLNSGAALATVVGVLVEVPVMLSLVAISNRTKSYFGDLNGNS